MTKIIDPIIPKIKGKYPFSNHHKSMTWMVDRIIDPQNSKRQGEILLGESPQVNDLDGG
jgi:hypothetical protein